MEKGLVLRRLGRLGNKDRRNLQAALNAIPVNAIMHFNISKLENNDQTDFEMIALSLKTEKYERFPLTLYVAPILSLQA